MSQNLPLVSCLCPTYGRPTLLSNSIACFEAQDYPADRCELLVLDDAGQLPRTYQKNWNVQSLSTRFKSLPAKFNALAGLASGQIFVVWEDDDIYLPWHLSAIVEAISVVGFDKACTAKPAKVFSTYTGRPQLENAAGRFHASLAFTRAAYQTVGGWPLTNQAQFDLMLISMLGAKTEFVDPCKIDYSSYVFRWGDTHSYHGQNTMRSPDDTEWYAKHLIDPAKIKPITEVIATFDDSTRKVYKELVPPDRLARVPNFD